MAGGYAEQEAEARRSLRQSQPLLVLSLLVVLRLLYYLGIMSPGIGSMDSTGCRSRLSLTSLGLSHLTSTLSRHGLDFIPLSSGLFVSEKKVLTTSIDAIETETEIFF